jgi:hypothetical protein
MEDKREPWEQDNEPPVPTATGIEAGFASAAGALDREKRAYIEARTHLTLLDAEKLLLGIEHDFSFAIEETIAATQDYIAAESLQARTRVRVIEKLMAESEAAIGRKQNEAKRGETLSISAAEKIVSGHPEYTAVRDDVAEKLSYKSACDLRVKLLEQTLLNMREILQSRRAGFLIIHPDGHIQPLHSASSRPAPRSVDLQELERDIVRNRDSRGLDGIERKPMQEARREPSIERHGLGGHALSEMLDSDEQR